MNLTRAKGVFVFSFFISIFIVLVVYINETRDFVITTYNTSIYHFVKNADVVSDISVTPKKLPVEVHWTFECSENKCVRKFYSNKNEKRTSYRTCTMTCGKTLKIWPYPTKAEINKTFKPFTLSNVQFKIMTELQNVNDLLEEAIEILVADIKQIVLTADGTTDMNQYIQNSTLNIVNISLHVTESSTVSLSLSTNECYELSISNSENLIKVEIHGKTYHGVRHGLETLQQLIWYDDSTESLSIMTSAMIRDCPKFRYRGLMLDTSRNYFSVDTVKRIINGMSRVKLNHFHWHMTDSQSFPYVSKNYPELSTYGAYSAREVYTHENIRDVVHYAKVRGIQVIPEIDVPAHTGNGWQWGQEKGLGELALCINQQPWMNYCGEPSCGQLNPKNKNTLMILQSLYEELISLTNATDFFHIGGDEVNFDCWRKHFEHEDLNELWCNFMLKAHEKLTRANNDKLFKHVTIWNSDWSKIKCLPAQNFTLQVWLAQPRQIQQFLAANYNLIISHVDAWYMDCGFGSWRDVKGVGTCPPFKAWYTMYNYRPWQTLIINEAQKQQVKNMKKDIRAAQEKKP